METKPGQGYLCGFEENEISKRWKVKLYDEYWKLWEIKIENENGYNAFWSVVLWTDDGLGHRVAGVLTTDALIDVVRHLSNPSDLQEGYVRSVFHILKDGRLVISVEALTTSLYKVQAGRMKKIIRFSSQQRRNLGEALKEIPMLQVLGILERTNE